MHRLQLFCVLIAISTAKQPFRSAKAPRESIRNYDVVLPMIAYRDSNEVHPKVVRILISTKPHDRVGSFVLQLKLNEGLLSPHFTSRYYNQDGSERLLQGQINCFYHGRVEGHPDWKVTMSTCQGLRGSFGDLHNSSQYYHLEPLSDKNALLQQPHVLYLSSEYSDQEGSCGSDEHDTQVPANLEVFSRNPATKLRQQSNNLLIVEWILVNDILQYRQFGENITATVLRAIEVANFVDMLYQVLGIRVVLVDVITWTQYDKIDVVRNPTTLLRNFRNFQPQVQSQYDSIMLLTSTKLSGNTVGKAYIGGMCDDSMSVGITQDRGVPLERVGGTAAHELGHIFGMTHDDPPENCNCLDPSGICLMSATVKSRDPMTWSNCSMYELQQGLEVKDLGRCLTNEPAAIVTDPLCGNGIREMDEVCDCGNPEECQDPCCDATTCKLQEGAECHSGPCCQADCHFKAYGTKCRGTDDECDIPEYCTGDSFSCPEDVHLQDGHTCSNESLCFSGLCINYDEQCQSNFGSDSQMAVQECYTELNTQGTEEGHCGFSDTQFLPCSESNALCGQLQCTPGDFTGTTDLGGLITPIETTITLPNGEMLACYSVTSHPGADIQSPGLVRDGSKCASEKLCYEQQCIPVSGLDYVQLCPVGLDGSVCSKRGSCNNRNKCSCDVGYVGDACESQYVADTTTQGNNAGRNASIAAAVVLSLVTITAVLAGTFCFAKYRRAEQNRQPHSLRSTKMQPAMVQNGHSQRQDNDPQNKSRNHRQLNNSTNNDAELSTLPVVSARSPPPKLPTSSSTPASTTASRDLAPEILNIPQEYGEGYEDADHGSELLLKPRKPPVSVLAKPPTESLTQTPVVIYSKHDGVTFQPSDASVKYPESNRRMAGLHPDSRFQASSGPKPSHHHQSNRATPLPLNPLGLNLKRGRYEHTSQI